VQRHAAGCPSLSRFPEYTRNGIRAIGPGQHLKWEAPRSGSVIHGPRLASGSASADRPHNNAGGTTPASGMPGCSGPGDGLALINYLCRVPGLDGMCARWRMSAGGYLGGQMARSSKRADRAAVSVLLCGAIIGLVTFAVVTIRQGNLHLGTKYIAWAFIPLMLLLGFTLRVQCRVKTTRGTACGNEAYGLLFGCNRTAGHHWGKFRRRLGLQADPTFVGQSKGSRAMMYQPEPHTQTVKLTIEDNLLSKCGLWATLVSTVVGVIGLLLQAHLF
jgi:hypothetical protein